MHRLSIQDQLLDLGGQHQIEATTPLSIQQQDIWLANTLAGQEPIYHEAFTIDLPGPVNPYALQQSFNEIIRRHQVMRTTYDLGNTGPIQKIHIQMKLALQVVDLTSVEILQRESQAVELATADARRPFDLTRDVPFRALLVKLDDRRDRLYLTVHRIAADTYSVCEVLIAELRCLYDAFSAGQPSPLPPSPRQYADCVGRHRQHLSRKTLDKNRAYWKQKLADATPLVLPSDRSQPSTRTFGGAWHGLSLPSSMAESLGAIGDQEGTTCNITLLTAFKVLLWRYTGQDDIIVGTVIGGRACDEYKEVLGHFNRPVVLRTALTEGMTFRQLLGRVRDLYQEAAVHQDVPFWKLTEDLSIGDDATPHPLYQVQFVAQPAISAHRSGWRIGQMDVQTGASELDLSIHVAEAEHGFVGRIEYNTDLFDKQTIERLADHLRTLLAGIVSDPNQQIDRLPLLTESERHQLLVQWNETRSEYPRDRRVHHLVQQQADRTPHAPAVIFNDQSLTFAQLNRRANQLGHHLRRLGVGPGVIVAICTERCCEMVIAKLAVLKAGGAYVPLDPSYPKQRLAFILSDTKAGVLVTWSTLKDQVGGYGGQIVALDTDLPLIQLEDDTDPSSGVAVGDPAYVIYTSGSTGTPKGVAIGHGSLLNLIYWHQRTYNVTPADRATQLAAVGFDACVWELWPYLAAGACVHLVDQVTRSTPTALWQWLADEHITRVFAPTPLAESLLRVPLPEGLSLRTMLTGGDRLRHAPQVTLPFELVNHYGPTENTVVTTSAVVTVASRGDPPPPIGRPIANTRVYILDARRQPVPIGIPGELYIAGDGLARGYMNRDELTAEKFIADPFSGDPAARLYRTGDRCRYRSDGNIEFLGRADDQVKVRGFRIELGEIEAVLISHPSVKQAVVSVRETSHHDQQLVGYVVPAVDPTPPASVWRDHLRQALPPYMVPALFVVLDAVPLTPHGKVDQGALPAPDQSQQEPDHPDSTPRTPVERQLAEIWIDILGIDRVGVHDSFFDLGGHSLKAMILVARISQAFDVELSVHTVLGSPTIWQLAEVIEPQLATGHRASTGDVQPVSRKQRLPLSFGEERLLFLDRHGSGHYTYHEPVALRLRGPLDIEIFKRSLNAMAQRHEVLRTGFQVDASGPVRVIAPQINLSIEISDPDNLHGSDQQRSLMDQVNAWVRQRIDLGRPPLMRVKVWRLNETDHVLVMLFHHIVCDEWSIRQMYQELNALYQAGGDPDQAHLDALDVQMADVAVWQHRTWSSGAWNDQMAYWREKMANAPTTLQLPTDRPRPPVQTYVGATHAIQVDAQTTETLRSLGRQQDATLFMTLLAAFKSLLFRYTQQTDLVLGSPIARRDRTEIRHTIGFFLNTLPFRTDLSGDPTFRQLLDRVRQTALDTYAHADVPFEKLVSGLCTDRQASSSPLFQVAFVLINQDDQGVFAPPGVDAQPIAVSTGTAKFDLMMSFHEVDRRLSGEFEYNTDLFDSTTIQRMAGHMVTLLEGIASCPDRPLSQLPLFTDRQKHQLIVRWNNTAADYPNQRCIHHAFEQQVSITPDAVAVYSEPETLTYRQLNDRANQLAHHLRALGVQPESVVGICLERSAAMAIGLLGILKAGGAYLPLDPGYPPDRLAFMLDDAHAAFILTHRPLLAKLPKPTNARVLCMDAEQSSISNRSQANPAHGVTSKNLAYLIYTSGSTGRPKAVAVEHRNTVALLSWAHKVFTKEELAGVLASTSINFDLSVFEFFVPLTAGGTVVLAENLLQLPRLATLQRVTLVNTVPSLMSHLLDANGLPNSVRTVNLAGEPLALSLVQRIYQQRGVERVYDLYGPSEDTTYSTYALRNPAGPSTIGRPIDNTRVYILDDHLQPLPVGVPGQLYIGGDGLARGYLNRPKLTAEKFIPDPFSDEPSARLYRTGDQCRYLPDGNIEYVGRLDDQVKIRGFRIELGEIESVLSGHPTVRQAAVVVREDSRGDGQLIAYVVPTVQPPPQTSVWRDHVFESLPRHMVPSSFVVLQELPLTPNGKIDRRSLPAPEEERLDQKASFVPARNSLERRLTAIWKEVLGLHRIGVEDNFFELGGHSLVALRVFSQIEKQFGRSLPLSSLFTAPTISRLAALLDNAVTVGTCQPVVPLQPDGTGPRLFAVPGIGGHPFSFMPLTQKLGSDHRFYALQLPGLDGRQSPLNRVEQMADYFIPHIRGQQPDGPYHLIGYSFGGLIAYEIARRLTEQGQTVGLLILLDTYVATALVQKRSKDRWLTTRWWRARWRRATGIRGRLSDWYTDIHRRSDQPFERAGSDEHTTLSQTIDRVTQANKRAIETYRPEPYPGHGVLVQAQQTLDSDELGMYATDGYKVWQALFRGGLEQLSVPAAHLELFSEAAVPLIADKIHAMLGWADP